MAGNRRDGIGDLNRGIRVSTARRAGAGLIEEGARLFQRSRDATTGFRGCRRCWSWSQAAPYGQRDGSWRLMAMGGVRYRSMFPSFCVMRRIV
jgi:hypothetical protein